MPSWFEETHVTIELGGRPMTISTGRVAKQAAGAVVVRQGDTVVLVTTVHSNPRPGSISFRSRSTWSRSLPPVARFPAASSSAKDVYRIGKC